MNALEKHKRHEQLINLNGDNIMTVTELKQKRAYLLDENGDIFEKIEREARDLTTGEVEIVKENQKEIDGLTSKIKLKEKQLQGDANGDGFVSVNNFKSINVQPNSESKWIDPNTGREVRVLESHEKLYRSNSGWDDFDMSKAIRALATGDYTGAKNEVRAMDLSGTAATVPTPISQRLIDRARDMMVLNRLGMRTVPMTSSTLTFASVDSDGDPSPEWKSENDSFDNSDVGISGVTLTAKTIIAGTSMSHELASDSPNASQVVEDVIARTIAGAIDKAGLIGSGTSPEPQGIFGATGVTDTDLGDVPGYDDFSDLYYRLTGANEQPNGLVSAPRTFKTLDQMKDDEGRYLAPPQSWSNFQKASTNAIPTDGGSGDNESIAIMGDFRQLFQGIRENLQIEVSRQASTDTESAWQELKVFIRVFSRIDFALARPGAFQTLSEILETAP